MTPDPDGLRGLARSIDRLFSEVEDQPVDEGEASAEEADEAGSAAAGGTDLPTDVERAEAESERPEDEEGPGEAAGIDAFWEMDDIASTTEARVPELEGTEFDAEQLDAPELDDAAVAASGLGGDDFDLSDLDRVDYDPADFDADFDEEAWADVLAETPEAGEENDRSAELPDPDEPPKEDPEWDEMDAWGLDLVVDGRSEQAGTALDEGESGVPAAGTAAPFERAVDTYLAGSENPTRARLRIQHYAEALVEEGDVDEVADGVERLAEAGGDAIEVAQDILAPAVAHVLASRLASVTGEDERSDRIELAVRLGYDFAWALSEVLAETENKVARYALVDALVAMGVDGWDAVVEMVGDERWWVVRNAVLVLGRTGGEESVRFLTRTVEHDDPRVRLETVEALEEIGGVKARERIQSRLDDEAPRVRAAAVRAVGTLGVEGARERLRTMLEQESDETVQVAVIETLGKMGDAHSIGRFERKLEGSFFRKSTTAIRAAVYGAFGAIGTPRALELLRAAAEEKDPVTRTLARRVLRDREVGEEDEGIR